MRNYLVLTILFTTLFLSCTKVNSLSDEASIETFSIHDITSGINIDPDAIIIENNIVILPLEFGRKLFPLNFKADIRLSSTTEDVIGSGNNTVNLKEFTFDDVYTPYSFYLISESGVPHLWTIRLKDKLNAEIEAFETESTTSEIKSVNIWHNNIRINLTNKPSWPISITPKITKTSSATYGENYKEGDPIVFTSYTDIKSITLVADNGDEREWQIQITPSIENSDFELWTNANDPAKINIDPTPGKGRGWATANNSFVTGTSRIPYKDGWAAHMATSVQDLNFLGFGELITAGTLYTGYFSLNMNLDNPRSMTYFSIPFLARPTSISFEARYEAGKTLQKSVKTDKYRLVNQEGSDKGHVWVELLHWNGQGELKYHGQSAIDGLTVLGRGEHIFNANEPNTTRWNNYIIPIKYNNSYNQLEPTHIAVVMTSSKDGDLFIGAIGSILDVDNVTINY